MTKAQTSGFAEFAFVSAGQGNHAVATLCRVLGASVSGFHAWLPAIPAVQTRAEAEADLRGHIGRIFAARRRAYGSPRVHAELRREGGRHGRRRVERLMREMGLSGRQGRRKVPCTTVQPPCPSGCPEPCGPQLHGRASRPGVAGGPHLDTVGEFRRWVSMGAEVIHEPAC